jgi:hypothetical protein
MLKINGLFINEEICSLAEGKNKTQFLDKEKRESL